MEEDARQGSSQVGRKDWAPLQFMETSGMVHVQNSTRIRCLGWERGLKGWGKREFLRWMGQDWHFQCSWVSLMLWPRGTSV